MVKLPRVPIGLASALVVLSACGGRGPSTGTDDDAGESDTSDEESDASGSDTDADGAMCTSENYADDPAQLQYTRRQCFEPLPDGSCEPCDLACMESIVYDCPIEHGGDPDLLAFNDCGNHTLLCSELFEGECCHLVTAEYDGVTPGRPLREAGAPLLPALDVEGTSTAPPQVQAAAARYRAFARYERASVDAFVSAAAVLESLGAPRSLIDRHYLAAREEAEHARLALAAAHALDGRHATLGELPSRPDANAPQADLEAFMRDLVRDGCVGESIASGEAAWALEQPSVHEHEVLRRYWTQVADEEAAHAVLAWDTLEWLLEREEVLAPVAGQAFASALAPRRVDAEASLGFGLAPSEVRARLHREAGAAFVRGSRARVGVG